MKKIVIINGSGGTGKDTFCDCCDYYIPTLRVSTVEKIKQAYKILGWDGSKSEIHRKALSDLKDIATSALDHSYKYVKETIDFFLRPDNDYVILFIHSREPEEIQRFVDDFGCLTLLIENPSIKRIESNHADSQVKDYKYDYVIKNDGTLEDLRNKANDFIENVIFCKGGI